MARLGTVDAPLAGLLTVDVERHGTAFGKAAAVVAELHPHLGRRQAGAGGVLDGRLGQARAGSAGGRARGRRAYAALVANASVPGRTSQRPR